MDNRLNVIEKSIEFRKLKDFYNKSDFASQFGISRSETRHSNFQAWLFDVSSDHNLKDKPIRFLLEGLVDIYPFSKELNGLIRSGDYSISRVKVYREKHNIDLLITFKLNDILVNIVIENKVYSVLSDTQLSKYKSIMERKNDKSEKVYLYLHPTFNNEIEKAKDDGYCSLTYQQLYEYVLKPLLDCLSEMKDSSLVEEYIYYSLESYIHCLAVPYMNDNGIIVTDIEVGLIKKLLDEYKDILFSVLEDAIRNDNEVFTTIFYKCCSFNLSIDTKIREKMSNALREKFYFFRGRKCKGIREFVMDLFNYLIYEERKSYDELVDIINYDSKNKLIATKEEIDGKKGINNPKWYDSSDCVIIDGIKYYVLNAYDSSDYFFIVNKVKDVFPDLDL